MESKIHFSSYFNPFDTSFQSLDFETLTPYQKIATVVCTVLGFFGLGIGALAAYRFCLLRFSKISIEEGLGSERARHSAQKVEQAARSIQPAQIVTPQREVSKRTEISKQKMEQYFKAKGETYRTSIDNGDCFYDSIAQSLPRDLIDTIRKHMPHPNVPDRDLLRLVVSDQANTLHRNNPEHNWVHEWFNNHKFELEGYEQFLQGVAKNAENNAEVIWGRFDLEAKLIYDWLKEKQIDVRLELYEFTLLEEIIPEKEVKAVEKQRQEDEWPPFDFVSEPKDGKCSCLYIANPPEGGEPSKAFGPEQAKSVVKIALYSNHFVPVKELPV